MQMSTNLIEILDIDSAINIYGSKTEYLIA